MSDFLKNEKCPVSTNTIAKEYDVLEQIFNRDDIVKQLLMDKYGDYQQRNRYSDILTYKKSRVKLVRGLYHNDKASDYINACYVNSPFENEDGSDFGDKKIIAS